MPSDLGKTLHEEAKAPEHYFICPMFILTAGQIKPKCTLKEILTVKVIFEMSCISVRLQGEGSPNSVTTEQSAYCYQSFL